MNLNPLRLLKREDRALETSSPLYEAWVANFGAMSSSGSVVSTETAIANVAVLACLIVRAETVASLPVGVYAKDGDTREPQSTHPVDRLLAKRPNPLMTSPEFWRWKQITEDLTGNAYARIVWRDGKPAELWPMTGQKPTVKIVDGRLLYVYNGDALTPKGNYSDKDVLHFKGPVLSNPFEAKSLVTLTAENIGLAIDLEHFMARFLGNGSHFPTYLETDDTLQKADLAALKEQMGSFSGVFEAGRLRIFDRGLKVKQNPMSIKDSDLSAQQRWILEQVCRTWRVPLAMVQDLTHGTYTNSEQQDLWLAKHTIAPIIRNNESVCDANLFLDGDPAYVKFNLNGLLRGDFKTRAEGISILINCGVMTRNQARALEDWNPIAGLDSPLVPLNLETVDPDSGPSTSDISSAAALIRTGFEPSAVLSALGLPAIAYNPVQPVTVRPVDDDGLQLAPAATDTERALAPILADAIDCIKTRAAQDRERGRDTESTIVFAERKLAPIAEAYRIAGADFDLEQIMKEALA